jgi:hypothetical protein
MGSIRTWLLLLAQRCHLSYLRLLHAAAAAAPAAAANIAVQVRYVLKNLVRDWSAEGALERQQCYARLVAQLKLCFEGW